jgi:hypothetical protein
MTAYNNIHIDGTAYAEQVAVRPGVLGIELNGGVPGMPGMPAPPPADSRSQDEQIKTAAKKEFETGIFNLLLQISHLQSGRAIMKEIRRLGRWIRIVPYIPEGEDWTGASERPYNETAGTRKHWLKRDNDGDVYAKRERGSGLGSACEIKFITPGLAARLRTPAAIKTPTKMPDPLAKADEILVHEMVHAIRDLAGVSARCRVPRQPRYDNFEEFYAIVVANVFRSECGRKEVRNDNHHAFESMSVGGKGFLALQFNRIHMQRFCRQHPFLAAELSSVSAYFNPFQHLRT